MISLRVLVHLWPAVPTAPKTDPRMAISISASPEMMIALLPPNSRRDLPNLAATVTATAFPIRVEPVAETRGNLVSAAIHSPTSLSPTTNTLTPSGTSFFAKTAETIFWQATAHRGVFSEGFQIQ